MTLYSGETQDFFGRRKWFNGLLGPIQTVPVEIETYQHDINKKWVAKVECETGVTQYVLGLSEAIQKPNIAEYKLGFNTEEELLNALPSHHISILGTFLELAEPKAQ